MSGRGGQPPIFVPLCSSTSIKRIRRVSWILMPATLVRPQRMGRAKRCYEGKGINGTGQLAKGGSDGHEVAFRPPALRKRRWESARHCVRRHTLRTGRAPFLLNRHRHLIRFEHTSV